ncbi:hypothetical protein ACFQV2_15695 [Actinokineospora soli]|uniref:Uncharacterized protein n=1 Tax=Actinokineospora soli TaxID=1048753 RepID=A0ABW2TM62_9PSEU
MTGPDGAHPHPHAVAHVLAALASAHPDLPEPVVRGVVLDAAGELAGAVPADFPASSGCAAPPASPR